MQGVWEKVRDGMAGVVATKGGTGQALCEKIGCQGNRLGGTVRLTVPVAD